MGEHSGRIRFNRLQLFLASFFAVFLTSQTCFAQQQSPKRWLKFGTGLFTKIYTVRIEHEGKVYYGRPIGQDPEKLALLRWDGRITVLPHMEKAELKSESFAPYTQKELTKRLKKQYGSRYLVQTSKHFMVVYPRTNQKNWADRYEKVYRQFRQFLVDNNVEVKEPKFPLIVVVLGSRREFERSLADQIIFKRNVFGYYSRLTNRVTTFVSSDPRIARQVERFATLTVIHEAIHQVAFNCGIHNRLCAVPRWMSEGFAMLFESNGFRNRKEDDPISKRVNQRRLATLKKMFLTGQVRDSIETMIRNDRMFETDPDLSYSLAWGLSFYLAEKQTETYLKFVKEDGNKKQFADYTPDERVDFFIKTFKTDFDQLERRLKKFILAL